MTQESTAAGKSLPNKQIKVSFRVNGGGGVGFGHLMRCLALAEAFEKRGAHITFIIKDIPQVVKLLQKYPYRLYSIPSQDSLEEDLEKSCKLTCDANVIIIDSYQITIDYLQRLKSENNLVAVFDDLAEHYLPVDVIVGNAYASQELYASKKSKETILLAGLDYIPLRKEFQGLSEFLISEKVSSLLISFGGEDPLNMTEKVVKLLKECPLKLTLNVLVGGGYKNLSSLERTLTSYPHSHYLFKSISNPLPVFYQSDVALIGAGVTLWELAAVGVPMLIVQTAQNQKELINYAIDKQLGLVLGNAADLNLSKIYAGIEKLGNRAVRKEYSLRCQKLIEGKGASRIVDKLIDLYFGKNLKLKKVNQDPEGEESHLLFNWRNDSTTRQVSRYQQLISWEEHVAWYRQAMSDPSKLIFIIWQDEKPVGMVRYDFIRKNQAEISINLDPTKRRQGLGKAALWVACRYGFQEFQLVGIKAEIHPHNKASLRIFESLGFIFEGMRDGFCSYTIGQAR